MSLIRKEAPTSYYEPPPQSGAPNKGINFALRFLRRRYPIILLCLVISSLIGAAYLLTTPPTYTATATMLIDSRKGQFFQNHSVLGDTPTDAPWIDSEIGVLSLERDKIGLSVSRDLHLADDGKLTGEEPTALSSLIARSVSFAPRISNLVQGENEAHSSPKTQAELLQLAAGVVAGNLDIKRIGMSYLLAINFSSHDPNEALRIANAAADAYVAAEMDTKFQEVRRASDWLQQRYQALGEQTAAAERAVAEFKHENNIITTGGKLINDQQLSELNSKLAQARARTAETHSKLSQIQTVLQSDGIARTFDQSVSDSLNDPIITMLRGKYLELANREADWSVRFGSKHLAVVDLRNKEHEIQRAIREELHRIAESYSSDYDVAKKNQAELEAELSKVGSQISNDAQIRLRALESSAESYRTFYDNFLLHYREAVQQESSPVSETRVVARASAAFKSHPSTFRIAGITVLAGIAFGIGLGMLQDTLDHAFRTREQVRTALNAECLALVPIAKNSCSRLSLAPPGSVGLMREDQRIFRPTTAVRRMTAAEPPSLFADAIEAIKLAADLYGDRNLSKVIGFTSSVPREGKSTIAMAFAQLSARVGARSILVDCDLRNPWLTRALAPRTDAGIVEVLSGRYSLEEVVWKDRSTGMAFLPAVVGPGLGNTSQILGGDDMKVLFDRLQAHYDYVIVDLPPLSPAVDARATTRLVDFYVFVIEWGQTPIDVVQQSLQEANGIGDNLLGVVLNKVRVSSIAKYDFNRAKYYRHKYLSPYGYSS